MNKISHYYFYHKNSIWFSWSWLVQESVYWRQWIEGVSCVMDSFGCVRVSFACTVTRILVADNTHWIWGLSALRRIESKGASFGDVDLLGQGIGEQFMNGRPWTACIKVNLYNSNSGSLVYSPSTKAIVLSTGSGRDKITDRSQDLVGTQYVRHVEFCMEGQNPSIGRKGVSWMIGLDQKVREQSMVPV